MEPIDKPNGYQVLLNPIENYIGKKITLHKTCNTEILQKIIQAYREKIDPIEDLMETSKEEPILTSSEWDVIATIKKVDNLFELTFEFFIPNQRRENDEKKEYDENLGKMVHLAIKGECGNVESHLSANGWNNLRGASYIELKAKVLESMLPPQHGDIITYLESEYPNELKAFLSVFPIATLYKRAADLFKNLPYNPLTIEMSPTKPSVVSKIVMVKNCTKVAEINQSNSPPFYNTHSYEDTLLKYPQKPFSPYSQKQIVSFNTDTTHFEMVKKNCTKVAEINQSNSPPHYNTHSYEDTLLKYPQKPLSPYSEKQIVPFNTDITHFEMIPSVIQNKPKNQITKRKKNLHVVQAKRDINLQLKSNPLSQHEEKSICTIPFNNVQPSPLPHHPLIELPSKELQPDLDTVSQYGRLRGSIASVRFRRLIVKEKIQESTLSTDLLTSIANILLQKALGSNKPDKVRQYRLSLKNFQEVSRHWWQACTNLTADYEKITLPKELIEKGILFPNDVQKMITQYVEHKKENIGTFYLDSNILKLMPPDEDATPTVLPTFCGCHDIYDTKKPLFYLFQNIPYFKHPHFSFPTALVDFISWDMIENVALLYIEDPLKRPSLAMPYTYEMSDSQVKGKGVFILQRFSVDGSNKEWWLFIDKPLDQDNTEARVVCFLQDYDKSINKKLLNSSNSTGQELTAKIYLEWLESFLTGQICEELPSSKNGIEEAIDTKKRIRHYLPQQLSKQ